MIDRHRLKLMWILMISSCSRVLHQLQRQTFLWDRFFPCIAEASHLYLGHCFFLRGGTLFSIHGSASSSEQSLVGILLLWGEPILSLFLSSFSIVYIGCMSSLGGLDYSIHPCILFYLSFWGRVFPMRFSLFPRFMGDVYLHCSWVPKMAS